jgi:SAM-dependent methyltransferase
MAMGTLISESDHAGYGAFASHYDDYTAGYRAASWTGKLLGLAQRHGAPQRGRLLDVGCGTGKSFLPMIERGWEVTGCDVSPAMVAIAKKKVGGSARLEVLDARGLPTLGRFDLVWALNDTLNYMLSEDELVLALLGAKRNLVPGGVLLFDLNTLSMCRAVATEDESCEVGGRQIRWTALSADFGPGGTCAARFEVLGDPEATELHRQRHFPEAQVLAAIERAGLECLGVWGDYEGRQEQPLDEERHQKAIYIVR